jgi:adenine phosphoribosyltransferase
MNISDLKRLIHDVPDFPKPGVVFKDITPLLANPAGFNHAVELLVDRLS